LFVFLFSGSFLQVLRPDPPLGRDLRRDSSLMKTRTLKLRPAGSPLSLLAGLAVAACLFFLYFFGSANAALKLQASNTSAEEFTAYPHPLFEASPACGPAPRYRPSSGLPYDRASSDANRRPAPKYEAVNAQACDCDGWMTPDVKSRPQPRFKDSEWIVATRHAPGTISPRSSANLTPYCTGPPVLTAARA
jgi:hypothetical protein